MRNINPSRKLVNFIAGSRRAPRHNYGIFSSGKSVGIVTSGSFSPSLSCGIGMGYVDVPCLVGIEIVLKENGIEFAATVARAPLYRKGTAKISEGFNAHTG